MEHFEIKIRSDTKRSSKYRYFNWDKKEMSYDKIFKEIIKLPDEIKNTVEYSLSLKYSFGVNDKDPSESKIFFIFLIVPSGKTCYSLTYDFPMMDLYNQKFKNEDDFVLAFNKSLYVARDYILIPGLKDLF